MVGSQLFSAVRSKRTEEEEWHDVRQTGTHDGSLPCPTGPIINNNTGLTVLAIYLALGFPKQTVLSSESDTIESRNGGDFKVEVNNRTVSVRRINPF